VPSEQGRERHFIYPDQHEQDLFHFICT
jgi:hypothetical protein